MSARTIAIRFIFSPSKRSAGRYDGPRVNPSTCSFYFRVYRNERRFSMKPLIRKTDRKARLTLPSDFASCLVTLERRGDELSVRKVKARRYSFKQLMAKVTKK